MGTKTRLKAADGHELDAYFAESSGLTRGAMYWSRKYLASTATFAPLPMIMPAQGFHVIAPALFNRVQRGP